MDLPWYALGGHEQRCFALYSISEEKNAFNKRDREKLKTNVNLSLG